MEKQLLFALDIGTRSVVGLIGQREQDKLRIIAVERLEHHTRSMLDGQIHDVPEVAEVIARIKAKLEETCGSLHKVAIAAAGRSLCTICAQAEIDASCRGVLTGQDERTLELSALQTAQRRLAALDALPDPTGYYCVGYSVTGFSVDGAKMVSLVGQRGKTAAIDLIATFLPRQVIDSVQSALSAAELELETITLEPIAAINVLIPSTMRHLNLSLVDVGAGTSDVAITRGGSVVAYGMVPSAGDEITEAISQHYLLDFNVAETLKRQLLKHKKVTFTDVLGMTHKISSADVLKIVQPNVMELARDIANQILSLNGSAPQAVLLVGGGSLTPLLPQAIAEALGIASARVAIRRPDGVEGFVNIPPELSEPDAVTPLGILKVAATNTLHFVTARVNDAPVRLFNLGKLTVADALLATGIDARSLHGRPGMGLTLRINGETRFLAGGSGEPGQLIVDGEPAKLNDPLIDNASITVRKGKNGLPPTAVVADVADAAPPISVTINSVLYEVKPIVYVNNRPAGPDTLLNDRDEVTWLHPQTVAQILDSCGLSIKPTLFRYNINGSERDFFVAPSLTINGEPANSDTLAKADADISITAAAPPTIAAVLDLDCVLNDMLNLQFNGKQCVLPARRISIACDGNPIKPDEIVQSGAKITFSVSQAPPTVSDVLLASGFNTRALPAGSQAIVRLNGNPAEYLAPVKNGDNVDVLIRHRG